MSAILGNLIKQNLLNRNILEEHKEKSSRLQRPVQVLLIESGLVAEKDLIRAARRVAPFLKVNLNRTRIDPQIVQAFPAAWAEHYGVFPIREESGILWLAMSDPSDILTSDLIRFLTGYGIRPVLCTPSQIKEYFQKYYIAQEPPANPLNEGAIPAEEKAGIITDHETKIDKTESEDGSMIQLMNDILCTAVQQRASDIHIEPQENGIEIRYRIDGYLKCTSRLPRELHARLLTRIKILAKLDIAERRKVQEGRIQVILEKDKVDLRISIIPLVHGEKAVIRILGSNRTQLSLDRLGFELPELELFHEIIHKNQGVVLVTGPTGSGKTTTLYAAIQHIKEESINIVTIEDPIEYMIEGVNQIQLSRHKDLTFANGLRSILRQDPDVILVGEIRDAETAEVAFQASLTGHFVFSTLHTNNAVSSVARLMNIGVEPYLISSALTMIVAQRLVRLICPHCRCLDKPDKNLMTRMRPFLERISIPRFYRGKGCPRCGFTGYFGRTSIFEMIKIDDKIRDLIQHKLPENVILKEARRQGMHTLAESGILKVAEGITTLEEVAKVTDILDSDKETDAFFDKIPVPRL